MHQDVSVDRQAYEFIRTTAYVSLIILANVLVNYSHENNVQHISTLLAYMYISNTYIIYIKIHIYKHSC